MASRDPSHFSIPVPDLQHYTLYDGVISHDQYDRDRGTETDRESEKGVKRIEEREGGGEGNGEVHGGP